MVLRLTLSSELYFIDSLCGIVSKIREKPSTKARREGYTQLSKLQKLLSLLLFPNLYSKEWQEKQDDHWLEQEFDKDGWRDFMIRHTPVLKRGGPSEQRPSKSKRRKQKQVDRKVTIR